MVASSRRLVWKNGCKKSMLPNTLIRNQSIIAGTRVAGTLLSHDSSDEGVSNCGPYWAPRHADSDRPPVPTDDGWNASRELSAPPGCLSTYQSSWPYTDTISPKRPWVLKDISSTRLQHCKRVHKWSLSHWTRQHQWRHVLAIPFIQSSLASFPTDFFCRILTTRYCLVTKKTSRPYEMGILLG